MDKTIDVIWKSYHEPDAISRGYWDQGLLEDMFKKGDFEHHTEFIDTDGAVVVINGRMHPHDVDKINADLAKLRWAVLIITGDEEAVFPWEEIQHPLKRVWVMLPRMNRHNDVSYKLVNGYRTGSHDVLKEAGLQERVYDFSFVGQVNHARREQCAEAAKGLTDKYNSYTLYTDGFGKEALQQKDYLEVMAQSKIVLCPSGIETPDNFRLYEALEAGCMPVVDAFAANNQDWGFWNYLFGEQPPFPVIPYWDELPNLLPQLLKDYPSNANKVYAWWQQFKRNMYLKLIDDITEVSK